MSDSSGNYSFAGLGSGSYVVTPTSQSVTYTPVSQPVTISGTNLSGINFTASSAAKVIFFDNFKRVVVELSLDGDFSSRGILAE